MRADLGAGAGRYTVDLGRPAVALDAAASMLALLGEAAPQALRVRADLEALPLRRGSLAGAWANMSYLHVPRPRLPLALAQLHAATAVGAPFDMQVTRGDIDLGSWTGDDFPGRAFAQWQSAHLADVVIGAGFAVDGVSETEDAVGVRGTRLRSLADTVGPGMRLLVCGLNPSIFSAERGVGFARRSNRFWSCAVEAGLVRLPFDPMVALTDCGVGMTDLVKRATVASSEITRVEYREGTARVERLVAWLQPAAVCFVGLEGWRAAVDRKAAPGWQPEPFGGRPAYLMPSTSGLNARSTRSDLVTHLRAAAAAPPPTRFGW